MFVLFVILWVIGILLLQSGSKRKSTYWASAIAFFGGAGELSLVIDEDIHHFVADLIQIPYLINVALFLDQFVLFLSHYGTPYAFLVFSICYSDLFSEINIKRMTYLLVTPIICMGIFYPIYPTLIVPYDISTFWVGVYIFSGIALLLYSHYKEEDEVVRSKRLLTNTVLIPSMLFAFTAIYIFDLFFNIPDAWENHSWVIFIAALIFLYFMFRYGIMGVKLSIEHQKMTHTMQVINTGSAMLNHAIKNDAGKIKLFGHKIKEYAKETDQEELLKDIQVILEAQHHMNTVLSRFKEQVKDQPLVKELTSIKEMIQSNIHALQPLLEKNNISILPFWEKSDFNDLSLLCDREQVKEAIYNILLNAVEAMPYGGKISIEVNIMSRFVNIEIRDTGLGIPKEVLPLIYSPFFSTKTGSKTNYGLGLAYCINVMKKHGGTLNVKSRENVGTTVCMQFPRGEQRWLNIIDI
jgi:two-component system sporulation sensor kinase B